MAINEAQMYRYKVLRTYMAGLLPGVITPYNSGLPKLPIERGLCNRIIQIMVGRENGWDFRTRDVLRENATEQNIELVIPDIQNGSMVYGDGRSYTKAEDIRFFFQVYCRGLRYWFACRNAGVDRYGIGFNRRGIVTPAEAAYARGELLRVLVTGGKKGASIRRRYRAILAQDGRQE